jgi:hypothetical protein
LNEGPAATVRGGLVPALHNFTRDIRIAFDRHAGHERASLHAVPIKQFECAWDALVGGIVEPAVCRQVWKVPFLRTGNGPNVFCGSCDPASNISEVVTAICALSGQNI